MDTKCPHVWLGVIKRQLGAHASCAHARARGGILAPLALGQFGACSEEEEEMATADTNCFRRRYAKTNKSLWLLVRVSSIEVNWAKSHLSVADRRGVWCHCVFCSRSRRSDSHSQATNEGKQLPTVLLCYFNWHYCNWWPTLCRISENHGLKVNLFSQRCLSGLWIYQVASLKCA